MTLKRLEKQTLSLQGRDIASRDVLNLGGAAFPGYTGIREISLSQNFSACVCFIIGREYSMAQDYSFPSTSHYKTQFLIAYSLTRLQPFGMKFSRLSETSASGTCTKIFQLFPRTRTRKNALFCLCHNILATSSSSEALTLLL